MSQHGTGCLVCGQELNYFDQAKTLKCEKCGRAFEANAACQDGHFVCDGCHALAGREWITARALATGSTGPLEIAHEMMAHKLIPMHGPEHHYLIVAALLAAYKNSGGRLDLAESLLEARRRSRKVPGGICGFWGCCGAAVGSGIFISLILGATPLSMAEWSQANKMTSLSLDLISRNGGPRCCKRNSWLAILRAISFVKERSGLKMTKPKAWRCAFFSHNPSCKKRFCLFYLLE